MLTSLSRALRREPYCVLTASSGATALGLLAEHPVDVVVSDHDMPGMNGTSLLARVRERYPQTVRMMLTGRGSLDVAIRAINDGEVSRFLAKPIHAGELSLAIREVVQQRELLLQSRRLLCALRARGSGADREDEEAAIAAPPTIVLDDASADLETLLREIEEELAAAQKPVGS